MEQGLTIFLNKAAVILAAGGLVLAGAIGPAQATSGTGWQVAATIAPHNEEVQLNAVTAIAPGDAWAVGVTGTSTGSIVEHWNGTGWNQVAVPARIMAKMSLLVSVAATSDRNVWAFGYDGRYLRFNGSSWTTGRVPTFAGGGSGLTISAGLAVGARGAWVFGFDSTPSRNITYAARFNGSKWQAVSLPSLPGQSANIDASAVSAGDIWAVVQGGPGQLTAANVLLHWNGRRWLAATLPSFLGRKVNLTSVLALPGGGVWMAGGIPGGAGHVQGLTALWNGHTWTVDKLAADPSTSQDEIGELVADGGGGVWAMGFTPRSCAGPMWHYSVGTWTDTGLAGCSVGAYVHGSQGLANVPGTTSVWGVGGQYDPHVPNGEAGLVLLYGSTP
jgi:hypothetical protein